jgi:biotin carboxyl carrier protein
MVKGLGVPVGEPGAGGAGGPGAEYEVVDGKQVLVAPMPGQVVKVNVCVGDGVKKKQCLVIVEAMKMENELITVIDGTVTAVHVEAGRQVDALQPLVEVTQEEA